MTHHNELNQPGMLSDGCSQAGFSVEDGNQWKSAGCEHEGSVAAYSTLDSRGYFLAMKRATKERLTSGTQGNGYSGYEVLVIEKNIQYLRWKG